MPRNRFGGTCYRCGGHVPAGEGHFERISHSHRVKWNAPELRGWLLQHADCAIRYRGTKAHFLYAPDPRSVTMEQAEKM